MLLLVDNDEPELLEFQAFGEERVGADDDVHGAALKTFLRLLRLGRCNQPGEPSDLDREALEPLHEVCIVLASEEGGRADQCHLKSGHCDDEGGAERDLGLSEADVTAHKPVHRLALLEIAEDFSDGAFLVVGFFIGKAIDELGKCRIRLDHRRRARRALGGDADEIAGDFANPLLHPRLAPLPGFAAKAIEGHALVLASVAGQQLDVFDGQIELVAARIADRDAVVRGLADRHLGQAVVPADSVLGVNDEVAGRQGGDLGEEGVGILAAPAAADQPVAEHVLLGQNRNIGSRKAVVQGEHEERRLRFRSERFRPAFDDLLRLQPMVFEQAGKALARAFGIAGEDNLLSASAELVDVVRDRFINIGIARALRSEIARRLDSEIDDGRAFGFGEGRGAVDRARLHRLVPFIVGYVERSRRERPVAARLGGHHPGPVLKVIFDALVA